MKSALLSLALFCATGAAQAAPGILSAIESEDLKPVPEAVSLAIGKQAGECQLQGEKIALSPNRKITTWFVTTADACDWGAANGPIWLVAEREASKPVVILSTGGAAVRIVNNQNSDFPDIAIAGGSAGDNDKNAIYSFNGKKYVKK
ncbi:MAG: hypothetical protein LBE24_02535 [Methylobacillus sp.]|nr:hypothetical protein [Methylobacillus sp.]